MTFLSSLPGHLVKGSSKMLLTREVLEDMDIGLDMNLLLHDSILYPQFLLYLQSIVSSENLLCARAIAIFSDFFIDTLSNNVARNDDGGSNQTPKSVSISNNPKNGPRG